MSNIEQTIEVSARSFDEAKRSAADKLNTSEDKLEIIVLEERKMLFGLGHVKIKASVKQEAKTARGGRQKKATSDKSATTGTKAKAGSTAKKDSSNKKRPLFAATNIEERLSEERATEKSEKAKMDPEAEDISATQDDANALMEIVQDILKKAELKATVKTKSINGRYVNLTIDGPDASLLIGSRGEVLNSFQYLLNVITAKELANGVRVTIDGNSYRKKRESSLSKLANQIAEEVIQRQEEAVLDALPALERRIIHQVLQDYKGIKTYSEGAEPDRKVVIAPSS